MKFFGLSAVLLWTVILNIYHAGVFPPPPVNRGEVAKAEWIDRREFGIHQLILQGPPFARGKRAGELTAPLLRLEEETLTAQLRGWVPSRLVLQGLILGAITWFQGLDKFFSLAELQEMYGTSLSAPKEFDDLADGFTRQIAYHGLHEVGQRMVDQGFEDMGCTVVAIPYQTGFVLGRNFDFEGGRIFDSEKLVKWVFPDEGYAFVSVIWAGMVGAVTGVNERGVYISINAAGSSDTRRLGKPSTLVLLQVLQHAATSEEALEILRAAPMFITDILVVLDRQGHLYRVEKSPAKLAVLRLDKPSIITNHLIAPEFADDPVNAFRKAELTSLAREKRGYELLSGFAPARTSTQAVNQVLSVLRDKGVDERGQPLGLGNRLAIDALIATHSVIYNPLDQIFYVGQGPAVSGPFSGYDLRASFAGRRPVKVAGLPADPLVSPETFNALKEANRQISSAHHHVQFKQCREGLNMLEQIAPNEREQSPYYQALGDARSCLGQSAGALEAWTKALALHPAYARFERDLRRKLAR